MQLELDAHLDWVEMLNQDIRVIQPNICRNGYVGIARLIIDQCDADIICRFIDTCCRLNDQHSKMPVTVLLNAFNEWSGDFWSSVRFVKTMKSQGLEIKSSTVFGLLTDCFIRIELVGNIY